MTRGEAGDELRDRRVLVVDDDATVAEVAISYLSAAGFVVDRAADGFEALRVLAERPPDLVVLDRMLPGIDGIEVCRRIRLTGATPIIMLTALGAEDDRIAGLESGADDYLTKPFSPRELVLRVQSVLRRTLTELAPESVFQAGPFHVDPSARRIELNGEVLALTAREYELLAFLLKRPNQVFGRTELLRAVWEWSHGDLSTVTVHVRRLREKLELDPAEPRLLVTVWGVGYRLDLPEGQRDGD